MLIDEILSVGDTKFKKKSYEKMKELIFDKNRTVMIVSHNPDTVRQLCTSVLWIHEGKVRMQGDVETVLEAYEGKHKDFQLQNGTESAMIILCLVQ